MGRLLTLLSLAALLCIAVGNSTVTPSVSMTTSISPSKAVASTSVSSMVMTSSKAPSSSVTPTPTPNPSPTPEPANKNYYVNNTGKVCLHMKAGLTLKFKYEASKENITVDVDFSNNTVIVHPDSYCNSTELKAILKLEYTPKGQMKPYFVTFYFNGTKSSWNVSEIMVSFTFNATNFPGYNGSDPNSNNLNSSSLSPLFNGGDVGFNKSFSCDVNRTINDFSHVTSYMNVSLFTMDLQVQAFDFKNPTSGAFDSSVLCAEANTGNKIVPIAVGAALAGLVIVVLVAYLIGRLRNRKKSSYEALS